MAVRTRIEPLDRDIAVILQQDLSPAAQSTALANFARSQLKDAQEMNRRALGRVPPHETFVDGRSTDAIESVRPNGVIVFEFELATDAIAWIEDMLIRHSPIKSGRFRKSHRLFADNVEVQFGADVPQAKEYVFINLQPYARKIERGLSRQAPDGAFQSVATLAQRRFGNHLQIRFSYRTPLYGAVNEWANQTRLQPRQRMNKRNRAEWLRRQPAIIVTSR